MLGRLTGWKVSCWQTRQLDSGRATRIYVELCVCVISSKSRNLCMAGERVAGESTKKRAASDCPLCLLFNFDLPCYFTVCSRP